TSVRRRSAASSIGAGSSMRSKNPLTSEIDMSISSCTDLPSSFQSSESGFSRVPWQLSHSVYARYFESRTRMCILYALLSSHLKKRRTPYQVPGHDLRQLTQS